MTISPSRRDEASRQSRVKLTRPVWRFGDALRTKDAAPEIELRSALRYAEGAGRAQLGRSGECRRIAVPIELGAAAKQRRHRRLLRRKTGRAIALPSARQ